MGKRVFVAITPQSASSEAIDQEVDRLRRAPQMVTSGESLRWVPRDKRHLTLGFARRADPAALFELEAILEELASRSNCIQMTYRGGGVFPSLRRPQVLWVGVGEGKGQVKTLGQEISRAMFQLGIGEPEREFKPHLTLARARNSPDLGWAVAMLERFTGPEEIVESIALYESELDSSGSRYAIVKEFALGGGTESVKASR